MKNVTESICDGPDEVIPMAEVSHVVKDKRKGYEGAISVIFKHSKWNNETQDLEPNVYMSPIVAKGFLSAWCTYRHELEIDTLSDVHHQTP